MTSHELKTWPKGFEAIWNGLKSYELRKDDRSFKKGDRLILQEWDPETERFTGRRIHARVAYITREGDFPGLQEGFIIIGLHNFLRADTGG